MLLAFVFCVGLQMVSSVASLLGGIDAAVSFLRLRLDCDGDSVNPFASCEGPLNGNPTRKRGFPRVPR